MSPWAIQPLPSASLVGGGDRSHGQGVRRRARRRGSRAPDHRVITPSTSASRFSREFPNCRRSGIRSRSGLRAQPPYRRGANRHAVQTEHRPFQRLCGVAHPLPNRARYRKDRRAGQSVDNPFGGVVVFSAWLAGRRLAGPGLRERVGRYGARSADRRRPKQNIALFIAISRGLVTDDAGSSALDMP